MTRAVITDRNQPPAFRIAGSPGLPDAGSMHLRKLIPLALCLATLPISVASADDFREWRDTVTGNTIEARMIDKRGAGDKLEVQLLDKKTRRTHWINVKDRLLPSEEEYVKKWVKPEERIKFLKFEWSPRHSKTMAWFAIDTGNHGIRVEVEPTGKPSQQFEFPANTKTTAYLPESVFARNNSGEALATVKVYSQDSDLYLFSMRKLK